MQNSCRSIFKRAAKNNAIVKLYHHLDLPALIDEYQQRNIKTSSPTKQSLQVSLEPKTHGIQQMSAFLFTASFAQLDNRYLDQYEILVNEPLHDISNYIKKLQHEIPHHVPKDKKALVKDIITSSFNSKEATNSADHRKSLLLITNWFLSNLKSHFSTNILTTLSVKYKKFCIYLTEKDLFKRQCDSFSQHLNMPCYLRSIWMVN